MSLPRDVVIIDYLRSPFSRSRPKEPEKDLLNGYTMSEMLGMLWKEIIRRNNLDPKDIEEAITGTSNPFLENFILGGKYPAFFGELPVEVASQQVDMACGSALCGMRTGAMSIACGYSDVVLAGGMEHMTHVNIYMKAIVTPEKLLNDPRYKKFDVEFSNNMGFTAQKLQEMTDFTRADMDRFALRSHQLAAKGQKDGFFKGEIMPVEITLPDGTKQMYDYDACVRGDTTAELLAGLKPAYKPDGTITAGNASPLNAGATAMLLMSREKADKLGLKPLASFVSFGVVGVDPTIMGAGPVPSAKKALKDASLQVKDIDYWEINEAFGIVPLYTIKELGLQEDRVNIHGGALAIGHPLGASGIRLTGTLSRILKEKNGKYGCATMCCGGGQGVAVIIKNE
ncbi:MAG: acetyl-CoA C-acetyltransferase [Dehalococcoidia bacterium]